MFLSGDGLALRSDFKYQYLNRSKTVSYAGDTAPPLSLLIFLTQVMLLNACMDVAKALSSLIDSTKDACGKPSDDPTMERLKSSAKEMVQSVR